MVVLATRGHAYISVNDTTNTVQEIYQAFPKPLAGPLIARGLYTSFRGPHARDSTVLVMFIDSTNRGKVGFSLASKNGMGKFPFMFPFTPDGVTKDFVLSVAVGTVSSSKTMVVFDHLSVTEAVEEKLP